MTARLFDQLKASCKDDWEAYTEHEFVRQLATGTLPKKSFQHYRTKNIETDKKRIYAK